MMLQVLKHALARRQNPAAVAAVSLLRISLQARRLRSSGVLCRYR